MASEKNKNENQVNNEISEADKSMGIGQALDECDVVEFTIVRDHWSGKLDFIFSVVGCAVGLGNIWRFPYLVAVNGGGAFLIPFLIMNFLVGIPLCLMEMAIGQYSSEGPTGCWGFAPLFRGIGITMMMIAGYISMYYNVILAWIYYYLFASFTSTLPWSYCGSWSSPNCTKDSASKEYASFKSLQTAHQGGFENVGAPRWDMSLCLFLTWLVTFFIMIKGIKSSGKVVYVTATFPYVVLLIFFFNGIWREGSKDGLLFLITPNLKQISKAQCWLDAASQVFFSLSISYGGLITLASYNNFNYDILRDTLIVCTADTLTGLFGGIVTFSYIGNLAYQINKPIEEVATNGLTLLFVTYPRAVTLLPIPTLWSILFFLMVLTLGIDSQIAFVDVVVECILCQFTYLRTLPRYVVMGGVCTTLFTAGLCMTTPGGTLIVELIDNSSAGWNMMVVGVFECLVVSYVYGAKNLADNIQEMIGEYSCGFIRWSIVKHWFIYTWSIIAPGLISVIVIYNFATLQTDKSRPVWVNVIGWLIGLSTLVPTLVVVVIQIVKEKGTFTERVKKLCAPSEQWGVVNKNTPSIHGVIVHRSEPERIEIIAEHASPFSKKVEAFKFKLKGARQSSINSLSLNANSISLNVQS